jgi:hypothetical protein
VPVVNDEAKVVVEVVIMDVLEEDLVEDFVVVVVVDVVVEDFVVVVVAEVVFKKISPMYSFIM